MKQFFTILILCLSILSKAQIRTFNITSPVNIPAQKEGMRYFVRIKADTPAIITTTIDYTIMSKQDGSGIDKSSQFINFNPAGNITFNIGDTLKEVEFYAKNDGITEGNDTAYFILGNVTPSPHKVGSRNYSRLIIQDSTTSGGGGGTGNPLTITSISSLRGTGTVPTNVDSTRKVRGVVYGVNSRTTGFNNLSVCDGTGCIGIFGSKNYGTYRPTEGDSIEIIGTVAVFRGLAQMSLSKLGDTIFKVTPSKVVLKSPIVVTSLDEASESKLVRINGLKLASGAPAWSSSSFTLPMTPSSGSPTYDIRIVNDSNRISSSALIVSGKTYNIVGLGGQFDVATPPTSGYQLSPRSAADIIDASAPIGINEVKLSSISVYPNPANQAFQIKFEALQSGTGTIEISNLLGNVVYKNEVKVIPGSNTIRIDRSSSLSNGIYLIRMKMDDSIQTIPIELKN